MSHRPRFKWAYARRLTAGLFVMLLALGGFDWFPWFNGTTAATNAFGLIPFVDPLAGIEFMLASRETSTQVLLGVSLLTGVAVVIGPVFCGWVCPLGWLLDLNDAIRRTLFKRFRTKPFGAQRRMKPHARYLVLGLVLGLALTLRLPLFQILSPINLFSWAIVFGAWVGIAIIALLIVVEWILPRSWCRVVCPLGAFYSLVGRRGLLRVRINPAEAGKTPCHQCSLRCPMGVPVMEEYSLAGKSGVDHPECTRCGDCVDVCPRPVLSMGFRNIDPKVPGSGDHCDECLEHTACDQQQPIQLNA